MVCSSLRAAGLLLLLGIVTNLAHPQTTDKIDKPSVPKLEARKIDLHKVSNEDLLKQAQLVLDRGSAIYLAQLRELATIELAYLRARKATDDVAIPAEVPPTGQGDPLEQARLALERSRGRLDALKKRLDLTTTEKALSERIASSVEASTSAALAFNNLLDDLNAFVVEINLRVRDRTLLADTVPKTLEPEALTQRKRDLLTEQDYWKQKTQGAQKELEAAGKRLESAKKAVLDADARFEQATRKHGQEQKQKEVEKEFAGRAAADLLAEANQLHEEEAGLIGAFNLALQRFRTREAETTQRRGEFDALEAPETKSGRGEDATAAIAATQAQQQYSARRVQAIEALRTSLQGLLTQGGLVEGESAVLSEHLFKVQVVVNAVEKANAKEATKVALSQGLEPTAVAARVKSLGESTGASLAIVELAKASLADLAPKAKEARTAEEEASKRLGDLKQTQEAGQRVLAFEKTLRQKNAAEVLAEFNKAVQSLEEKSPALAKQAARFDELGTGAAGLRKKREGLKDPFVRVAEAESQAEKQKLLDELKKHAGLDRAPRDGMGGMMSMPTGMEAGMTPGSMTMTPPEPKSADDKDKGKTKDTEKVDPLSVQGFQQMLATRARVVEEQGQLGGQLIEALKEREKAGEVYSTALGEVRELALQRYAVAVDLKKRLGRGELKSEDVPEKITQALNREELARLEATAAALVAAQAQTRQEQEKLTRADAVRDALNKALQETLALASQRLDLLSDLKRLEQEYKREKKDLSESDVKRLEQAAIERIGKEDGWLDSFLSIDSSPQAKALVEVLQTYYREAITLEERQDLLKTRKEKAEKLVDLAQKELALLMQAQPLVRQYQAALDRQREEELILVKARLKPEEADELLRNYQAKTGKQLARPVGLPEKDRPAAVTEANVTLFDRLLDIEATRRWERLIEGRLSPQGLTAEVGSYQDQLGSLSASYGTNLRRIQALGGKVELSPAFPQPSEATTATEPSEITGARQNLFEVRRDGMLWILAKIALVLLFGWLTPLLLTILLRRGISIAERGGGQAHAKLVLTFMQAFMKLIVYTIALVLVLSILGFDITAILAGLGIGGLAIGLAAQHAISDILGGLIIFLERPFSIGDTVKIGDAEAGQVTGLTWRITQMRDADGVSINIPNRRVTEESIINLTREGGKTYDSIPILVPAVYPVADVVGWIEQALQRCTVPLPGTPRGVDVEELSVSMMGTYYIRYSPSYFLRGLAQRDDARAEVLGLVCAILAEKGVVVAPEK